MKPSPVVMEYQITFHYHTLTSPFNLSPSLVKLARFLDRFEQEIRKVRDEKSFTYTPKFQESMQKVPIRAISIFTYLSFPGIRRLCSCCRGIGRKFIFIRPYIAKKHTYEDHPRLRASRLLHGEIRSKIL